MRISTVIDAAHGGQAAAGHSTPFGERGAAGLLEKDVTLRLARKVAAHLGGEAHLTRSGDVNLPLGERAGSARKLGARAFISLHAGRESTGAGVWVHPQAAAASSALAAGLSRELARFGSRVRRGELAILSPTVHGGGAACVVELGGLGNAVGERRLRDDRYLDALADSVARGVRGFLGGAPVGAQGQHGQGAYGQHGQGAYGQHGQGAAYGRVARGLALDLTDFVESRLIIYPPGDVAGFPARMTQAEADALKIAWDRMMRGVGLNLHGDPANVTAFRQMLFDCMMTSRVLRDAFMGIAVDDGTTVDADIARSPANVTLDAFEFSVIAGAPARGAHSFDLDDLEAVPRVGSGTHLQFIGQTEWLVHGLVEATLGARSAIAGAAGLSGRPRYLACHASARAADNRYRVEEQMPTIVDDAFINQAPDRSTVTFHLRNTAGVELATETWHMTRSPGAVIADTISSIDHTP